MSTKIGWPVKSPDQDVIRVQGACENADRQATWSRRSTPAPPHLCGLMLEDYSKRGQDLPYWNTLRSKFALFAFVQTSFAQRTYFRMCRVEGSLVSVRVRLDSTRKSCHHVSNPPTCLKSLSSPLRLDAAFWSTNCQGPYQHSSRTA